MRTAAKGVVDAIDRVTGAMAAMSAFVLVAMLLLTIADVVRRATADKSIDGVNELSEVAMIGIVFLGAAYAEQQRAHVAMTLVVRKMSERASAIAEAAAVLFVMVIVAWMVWVTGERALVSLEAGEHRFGIVRIPIWPARICIAVGLAAYLLQLAIRLAEDIARAGRSPRHSIRPTADAAPGY